MSDITWDDVPEKMVQWSRVVNCGGSFADEKHYCESQARCFSCGTWSDIDSPFGDELFTLNYDEEYGAVPVCKTCAEGRVVPP